MIEFPLQLGGNIGIETESKRVSGPTEAIELKSGLKFSAEARVVIASASTEANIEIQLTWRKPPTSP